MHTPLTRPPDTGFLSGGGGICLFWISMTQLNSKLCFCENSPRFHQIVSNCDAKSKINIFRGSMPPDLPSLPPVLHTDTYLPPLAQKAERNWQQYFLFYLFFYAWNCRHLTYSWQSRHGKVHPVQWLTLHIIKETRIIGPYLDLCMGPRFCAPPPNRDRTENESQPLDWRNMKQKDRKTYKQTELYKGQCALLQASYALVSQSQALTHT